MTKDAPFIHELSDVQSENIGARTSVWQFVVILAGARIGADCNICSHCFIENDVSVGDRVTIKNGVQLWDGIWTGNDVFIGPNATFTNDAAPRSKQHPQEFMGTHVEQGASIGANATILPGLSIGQNAMVGAGAVVTRSIPPNAVAVGNPARVIGYIGSKADGTPADEKGAPQKKSGVAETSVRGAKLHNLPRFRDPRGSLTVGEFPAAIPFTVARYFMVFDVPSAEVRGEHAHKECHQFLLAAHGSVSVVADDGENREEFTLDSPEKGLHLGPMTWGIQYKYSNDAVLLVFASHPYDPEDYIRDYDVFRRLLEA